MACAKEVTIECKAILFDMDGTLVDSTPVVERQWKRFAEKHHLDYAQIMRVAHGRRNEETIREIAPHLATPEVFAEFDASEIEDRGGVSVVRGAEAMLGKLAPHEWAVVTSASRELARTRLQLAHLPAPKVLVGADDVERGKPDPEGYLTAARRLGVVSGHCVVFEDTRPGLEAARAAGMCGVGITTTYSHVELTPADCVADFESVEIKHSPSGTIRLRLHCF